MIKHAALGSRWAEILNLNLRPVTAHLRRQQPLAHPGHGGDLRPIPLGGQPPPLPGLSGLERRNITGRERMLLRICAEFKEMPELSVTLEQAIKLFGLTPESGPRILQELLDAGVLGITRDFHYVLRAGR